MRRRSRYGRVDPDNPEAAARCDRGGHVVKRSELREQMKWAGERLVGTGWLVCPRCMDVPNPQDRSAAPGPDPVPVDRPRPLLERPADE